MPIISEEKKKRQFLLLVLTVLFLGGSSIILYQGVFKSRAPGNLIPEKLFEGIPEKVFGEETVPLSAGFADLSTIELDRKIFDDTRFTSLEVHGLFPIVVRKEEVGRENPFLPPSF